MKNEEKMWFFIETRNDSFIKYCTFEEASNVPGITSRSPGYDTEQKLRIDMNISDKPCTKCGRIFGRHYTNMTGNETICFHCMLWESIKLRVNHGEAIVVAGSAYVDRGFVSGNKLYFQGFGGRVFRYIRNGHHTPVVTNNMWHLGDVPTHFREELPDNAVFV